MHNHDDKYRARPGCEPGASRLQAQSIRMSLNLRGYIAHHRTVIVMVFKKSKPVETDI